MKYFKYIIVAMLFLVGKGLVAQNLSYKTNYVYLDYKSGGDLPNLKNLPELTWFEPANEFTSKIDRKVKINAKVNSITPMKEVTLVIGDEKNGDILSSKTIAVNGKRFYEVKHELTLPKGLSSIEIIVTTTDGGKIAGIRKVMVGSDTPENVLKERKDFALMFATDKYHNFSDLVNPIQDTDSIAKVLEDEYGFDVEVIKNPTTAQIWDKIREYSEKTYKPYDQLLVFFAGHGTYDEVYKEGYYIASDSDKDDSSGSTYISHIRLAKILDNNPCRRIMLTMDSCFGGAIGEVGSEEVEQGKSGSGGVTNQYEMTAEGMLVRKLSNQVRKYFTSGGKEYVSDGIRGKHSPFASKLLESLNTRGGDDNVLTMSEIRVNMEKLPQMPRFGEFGHNEVLGDFVFIPSVKEQKKFR